jgi:AAA+ superfamily predicted ATPase
MVASSKITTSLKRIIKEFVQRSELKKHGLQHRKKALLTGPLGTGKAMTASAIAHELELPLYMIHTDKIVMKYMGETVFKLRQVFDFINKQVGVYFFDEFDAIGVERAEDNNVGEIRCVLNSFLQFLKQDKSDSFIIVATNHFTLLDKTLLQSFDDVLFYELPKYNEALKLIKKNLASFPFDFKLETIMEHTVATLSHSEIRHACEDAIKTFILSESSSIQKTVLLDALAARKR